MYIPHNANFRQDKKFTSKMFMRKSDTKNDSLANLLKKIIIYCLCMYKEKSIVKILQSIVTLMS